MATHPVVFPGKSHGQRSLAGYSSRGHKRVRHDLVIQQQQSHIVVHLWRTGKVIKIQRGEKRKKTKKGRKTYYSHMNLVCPCDSISKLLEENFSSSGRKGGRKGRERKEREIREKRRKRKGKKKETGNLLPDCCHTLWAARQHRVKTVRSEQSFSVPPLSKQMFSWTHETKTDTKGCFSLFFLLRKIHMTGLFIA